MASRRAGRIDVPLSSRAVALSLRAPPGKEELGLGLPGPLGGRRALLLGPVEGSRGVRACGSRSCSSMALIPHFCFSPQPPLQLLYAAVSIPPPCASAFRRDHGPGQVYGKRHPARTRWIQTIDLKECWRLVCINNDCRACFNDEQLAALTKENLREAGCV